MVDTDAIRRELHDVTVAYGSIEVICDMPHEI